MGEAGSVAFGKAVFTESLDLVEAALGEGGVVTAPDHAVDHLALQILHDTAAAEGGHRPAQMIGVLRREAGGLDGHAHGLFLEQRHAQGLAQHLAQLVRRPVLGRRGRELHRL